MRLERLAALIQDYQAVLAAGSLYRATRERMISLLRAVNRDDLTQEQAACLLVYQAMRLQDEPAQAILSREAATDLEHLQREEGRSRW